MLDDSPGWQKIYRKVFPVSFLTFSMEFFFTFSLFSLVFSLDPPGRPLSGSLSESSDSPFSLFPFFSTFWVLVLRNQPSQVVFYNRLGVGECEIPFQPSLHEREASTWLGLPCEVSLGRGTHVRVVQELN